jgi:hypothetical protein
MIETLVPIPRDFMPLTVVIPGTDQPNLLGDCGDARFVGFYWDAEAGGAVWSDGQEGSIGHGENFTFTRFVRPLAFLYNVNFGTRGGKATHLLIWDRDNASAYIAPRESAFRFLQKANAANQILSPSDFAGPAQYFGP